MADPIPSVDCCPKCGGSEYLIRFRVSGYISEAFNFDSNIRADNTEMWDTVHLKPQKKITCRDCGAKISSKISTK